MYFHAEQKDEFILFSLTHWLTILVLFIVIGMIYFFRKQLKKAGANRAFRIGLAIVLIISEIALHSWLWWYDLWDIRFSMPLHLSSISLLLSAVLLITKNYSIFEFTFFAGIGSALQAMITPDISAYTFPHFRYIHFFISHGGIVIANIFFVIVEKYRPHFKSLLKTFLYLNIYALFIFLLNLLLGGNYMYISRKPINPSMLDYLGPWPLYIFPLELIAFLTFLILYLPFAIRDFLLKRKS